MKNILQPLTTFLINQTSRFRKLDVYTDGGHKGKWGTWAFVVVHKDQLIYQASGRVRYTDSLRMEFRAAIEALGYLKPGTQARFHADSKVLIRSAQGLQHPAAHDDQVRKLQTLMQHKTISWNWVRAHSGQKFNDLCDQLCVQAREV